MDLILRYVLNKMKKGHSPLIIVCGATRTGKTSLALKLASIIDPTFNVEKQMFFKIQDFAQALSVSNNKCLILDEAGVTLDPLEFQSVQQKVYNHLIQTQAFRVNCVFLVLPMARGIGKMHRDYVNAVLEVFARGCYKLYKTSIWHSDLSYKPPRLTHLETVIGVPLPPEHIWKPYQEFGQAAYKNTILDIQMAILEKKYGQQKPQEIVTAL